MICCILTSTCVQAQVPDFISVKKRNGISVKNYYAGTDISFVTKDNRRYDALIDRIVNDSIFLRYYDLYQYPNIFGTTSYDTVTTYILPVYYKNIKQILLPNLSYRNSLLRRLGIYATTGGFGYGVLNVANGLLQKAKPLFDNRNARNVAISTAVGLAGVYLQRRHGRNKQNYKRYKIVYVDMD